MGMHCVSHIILSVHAVTFKEGIRGKEKFEVKTWCLNPYTDEKVHFVICSSHQVCC